MKIDSMCRQCLLCYPHQHPILPHGYCHGWLCWARPLAHMYRYDVFYLKLFQRDRQIKESAGSNQEALSDAWNFRITEVMHKSWACSAISSNGFLIPSWCQKGVNCGKAIIPECLCSHFLRERHSSLQSSSTQSQMFSSFSSRQFSCIFIRYKTRPF